ncbi:hypothetical protein BJX64DRAFT_285728 [Aspergillus heterothallicus]
MALIQDPWFWKRFSRAVHLDEVVKSPAEEKEPTIWSDNWLENQQRKQRRSVLCGCMVFLLVIIFAAAITVVVWWFCAHNWLQTEREKPV